MSAVNETTRGSLGCEPPAQESSIHDALNEATQWLQYARGVAGLLADLIHEADEVNCQHLALSLEAIAAMTQHGVHKVADAHAQWHWNAK